jgi:hypothetical protein
MKFTKYKGIAYLIFLLPLIAASCISCINYAVVRNIVCRNARMRTDCLNSKTICFDKQ